LKPILVLALSQMKGYE